MRLVPIATFDNKILTAFNRAFHTYHKTSIRDITRLQTIRASALPFCVRSFLYGAADTHPTLDSFGAYYTSVGTTVHTWVQDLAATTGLILGNWYNEKTDKWRRFSLQPGPDWEYHELTATALGAVGHIDGVFCLDRKLARRANKAKSKKARIEAFVKLRVPLFVIDYKTCSLAGISGKIRESGSSYTYQLHFYCLALELLGLNVRGYGNFYIPRDNPSKWGMNAHPWKSKHRKYITKKIKQWGDLHAKAVRAKTWKQFCRLYEIAGPCDSHYCKVCRASNPKSVFADAFKRGSWPIKERFDDQ